MPGGDIEVDEDCLSIAVMVSGHGRGSNLAAIIAACDTGEIKGRVVVVIGTRADAPALERATASGVGTAVVSPRKYAEDEAGYAAALNKTLTRFNPQLICLAGYMRKLPTEVLSQYSGRVMNIHNALLPLFGGQGMYGEHVHSAVIKSGMKVSGCTVHFVDEQYDNGPIIVQSTVDVLDSDTPASLAARVLAAEHKSYVRAIRLFAEGKLHISPESRRVLGADPTQSC